MTYITVYLTVNAKSKNASLFLGDSTMNSTEKFAVFIIILAGLVLATGIYSIGKLNIQLKQQVYELQSQLDTIKYSYNK